ncbi:MAG: tetratricopeptide repeat protein [Desulfatibacillaceae bacterium]
MPKSTDDVKRDRHASREFLISETITPPESEARQKEPVGATLKEAYPDLLAGPAFVRHAVTRLKGVEAFVSTAISVDGLDEAENQEREVLEVAKIVDQAAGSVDTRFWGMLANGVFCVVMPDEDESAATGLGESVRKSVRESGDRTATAGVTVYPLIDFTREDTVKNTQKALDHAAFFGPDSQVVFDAVSLNVSGDQFYQEGDVDSAIIEFERALKLNPEETNVLNSLGVAYAVKEKPDQAMKCFDKARELAGSDIMPVYNTGLALLMAGQREQALRQFLEADSMEPGVFEILYQTGRVQLELGRAAEAVESCTRAVEARPDSSAAHRMLGDGLALSGSFREASKEYEKALRIFPNDAAALSSLGQMYAELGENLDIALSFARQSVNLAPENGLYHLRLARIHEKREEEDKALEFHEKARELGYSAIDTGTPGTEVEIVPAGKAEARASTGAKTQ